MDTYTTLPPEILLCISEACDDFTVAALRRVSWICNAYSVYNTQGAKTFVTQNKSEISKAEYKLILSQPLLCAKLCLRKRKWLEGPLHNATKLMLFEDEKWFIENFRVFSYVNAINLLAQRGYLRVLCHILSKYEAPSSSLACFSIHKLMQSWEQELFSEDLVINAVYNALKKVRGLRDVHSHCPELLSEKAHSGKFRKAMRTHKLLRTWFAKSHCLRLLRER